ncbi:MAG: helix-turn-helix transcriptional regulator [Pseudomonadota bacterium]
MPTDISREIGSRVQARRRELGISQEELAALCKCHRTYVGMVERAEKKISVVTLSKFARALKTSMSELLEGL